MNELPRRAVVAGRGIPLREDDIDTDRIIPARYLKCVTFDGLGKYAFYDARFGPDGEKKDHPFNDERFAGASILIGNRNFGCGSSREHAPQSLSKAGITALVAESFAEIFAGNCAAMGIPAVGVSAADAFALQYLVEADPATEIAVDLEAREVRAGGRRFPIVIRESYRASLVSGSWDATAELLLNEEGIRKTAAGLPYLAW
jgi:3-isopropylmalate/(R)-2-methylmalate dehydratase small subunit